MFLCKKTYIKDELNIGKIYSSILELGKSQDSIDEQMKRTDKKLQRIEIILKNIENNNRNIAEECNYTSFDEIEIIE